MDNYEIELDIEKNYLEKIISIAKQQLDILKKSNENQLNNVVSSKKEVWESTRHSIFNLWDSDGFYELASLSQYEMPITGKISILEMEKNKILSLEKTLSCPYFARIDFKFEDEEDFEKIYIGRNSLIDESGDEIHVYDWRSPLASVFYRFGAGTVWYDAPNGKITGEVRLKRQFEIYNGKLQYFFDADVQIIDEFLKNLLSKNASSKMKAIVETIQKDQDIVIRDMENDLMMVQGVAGSGKTSVALHRVAYLLYKGLSSKLSSQNIMIISPSILFEQYISGVLPELGENNVVSDNFENMFKSILPPIKIQTRYELLEEIINCKEKYKSKLYKTGVEFKASLEFKEILERFIKDIPKRWIEFNSIYYNGICIADRNFIKSEIINKKLTLPLALRLEQLEKSIFEKIHRMKKTRVKKLERFVKCYREHMYEVEAFARVLSIRENTLLANEIHKFTKLDVVYLYKKLFSDLKYLKKLATGISLPEEIDEIIKNTQINLGKEIFMYEDSLPLTFLQLKLNKINNRKSIKQIVIDEVQDYYPLHFEIVNLLFPHSKYTILGDIYQTIEKHENITFFEKISKILNKRKSTLVVMNKSFRCTNEIMNFSKRFLEINTKIESFNRVGECPQIYKFNNSNDLNKAIIGEIQFCKDKNYQSIGLLCKTENDAISLYNCLKEHIDISLISIDTITDIKGVFILPLYMAKGLEFDAVLLCNVNKENYFTDDDKKLLYIGCTRALHRLNLFCKGEISTLLLC